MPITVFRVSKTIKDLIVAVGRFVNRGDAREFIDVARVSDHGESSFYVHDTPLKKDDPRSSAARRRDETDNGKDSE